MAAIHDLLKRLWQGYSQMNPQAESIHRLLTERGEKVVNDHIALRTFDDPRVGIEVLSAGFLAGGYRAGDEYSFTEKKLAARHYEPLDVSLPKVFISELKLADFSENLRSLVGRLLDQVPEQTWTRSDLAVIGRPWALSHDEYLALAEESEYAAWMAAFGFRANHFTVLVNALATFDGLESFNAYLKQAGYQLNASGGEIKGSPEVCLEQSSTLADQVSVDFSDSVQTIPGCYYEFARRYPLPDGSLFGGFVARSADKIFESTNRR